MVVFNVSFSRSRGFLLFLQIRRQSQFTSLSHYFVPHAHAQPAALKILRPILEERAQRPSKSKSRNRKRPQGEVPEPVSSSMITEEMESDEE